MELRGRFSTHENQMGVIVTAILFAVL